MAEPTIIERIMMMFKTLASTVVWIVALAATMVRGRVKNSSDGA